MMASNLVRDCGGAVGGGAVRVERSPPSSGPSGAKADETMIIDSLPISFAIKTAKGVTAKVIIERNDDSTCKQVTTVTTTYKNAKPVVSVQVVEDEQSGTDDDYLIGTIDIRGIKKAPVIPTCEPAAVSPATATSSGLSLEALDLREIKWKKDMEKLQQEREMLAIGRKELNKDINRHKLLMQASIAEVNKQAAAERDAFIQALVLEMEQFKLPSLKRFINTDNADKLVSEAEKIEVECSRLCK